MNEMDEMQQLLDVVDRLIGPDGCPWDKEQTMNSLIPDLIEEVHELMDAILDQNPADVQEELGDVIFLTLLLARLAQKENYFDLSQTVAAVKNKLISRHPHVFKEKKELGVDQVLEQWDVLKAQEEGKAKRKSIF